MAFAAALASGLPLMVGAWFGHLEYGLISSIGGLAFLYLPNTPMSHRMVWLMACAFGMAASYALGLMTHFLPLARVGVLALIAVAGDHGLPLLPCRSAGEPVLRHGRGDRRLHARDGGARSRCASACSPWAPCSPA